jgi:hypothetical protein
VPPTAEIALHCDKEQFLKTTYHELHALLDGVTIFSHVVQLSVPSAQGDLVVYPWRVDGSVGLPSSAKVGGKDNSTYESIRQFSDLCEHCTFAAETLL